MKTQQIKPNEKPTTLATVDLNAVTGGHHHHHRGGYGYGYAYPAYAAYPAYPAYVPAYRVW